MPNINQSRIIFFVSFLSHFPYFFQLENNSKKIAYRYSKTPTQETLSNQSISLDRRRSSRLHELLLLRIARDLHCAVVSQRRAVERRIMSVTREDPLVCSSALPFPLFPGGELEILLVLRARAMRMKKKKRTEENREKGKTGNRQTRERGKHLQIASKRVETVRKTVQYNGIRFVRRSDQNTLQNATNPSNVDAVTCRCISS